uniref:Golgin B1 n=1 Tax=Amphilophus citrinellus TaxID=61819 RepID=A0A3Q0R2S8_AMPCI
MLKWFSGEEGEPGSRVSTHTHFPLLEGSVFTDVTARLTQTEQLVTQLKEMIREKDAALRSKDDQLKELSERLHRLQVERESLESRMEAEKHVMRAQLRDLMDKQQAEVQRMTEQHQAQMDQTQQDLMRQLEDLRRAQVAPARHMLVLSFPQSLSFVIFAAQAKQKTDEASRSEAKFLKMKAWSKSRIRQLEEELKKSQAGVAPPDLTALRSRITTLEEEREENLWKVEQYEELKAKNEMLEAKLVVYEEQQRTLQADLEQFTKRAASQASESGSIDDTQSQVLEWQEMVAEAVSARDRAREEKADDWFFPGCSDPALVTRQQELEEELAQARGLSHHRAKKLAATTQRSLQVESTTPMEGENMGGWWPEYSTPDTDGLRSVVEELELERNQLQEQILILEERCQDLEDRLQLQARIEALQVTFDVDEDEQPNWVSQNESEKLQSQLATVRSQQSREAEKHQLLVNSLNEQLKGLTDTQECLESSLIEKENTLAKTSEKLELINSLRESLSEKDIQCKELSDKLLQTEHTNISMKCTTSEKQCSELKTEVMDVTQKLSVLKEKAQKQEITIETMQTDLDQTNEELDKLNSSHLEERAQLIHDLQSCEREIDILKDALVEKDKEISTLVGNMAEYAEQVTALKQEIKLKDESLVQVENALRKAEREADIMKESQNSDQQTLNSKITELVEKIKEAEMELVKVRDERESKVLEVEHLIKQAEKDKTSIRDLRAEIQKQTVRLVLQLKDRNTINDKLQQESDVCTLSKQLEEQVQSEQSIKQTMQEKMEMIASLENQLKQVKDEGQKFNTELQLRDSENEKLCTELQSKSENISTLECVLKSATTEKEQLQENLKGLNEELELERNNVKELNEKVTSALEFNGSLETQVHFLTKERERLEVEVTERAKNISQVTAEMDSLQAKISVLETQHSQNTTIIQVLQKAKEELTVRTVELNRVLEQSTHSNSEILEKEETVTQLQEQDNCQLHAACESKEKELTQQTQLLSDLDGQLKTAVEQNSSFNVKISSLIEDNRRLKEELAQKMKSVSELSAERDVLQEKTCGLEIQISDSQKIIAGLLKEKEELAFATDELKKILKESEQANSVGLLEKTSECANLLKALREKDEQFQSLQEQVDGLKMQVSQLSTSLVEKEQTVSEQNSHIKTQQNQLLQLQDTISMLQEQGSVLKSGLMEKDAMLQQKAEECSVHQKEVMLQKELASQMQAEVVSLRKECLEAKQQLEQKEQALKEVTHEFQNHKDELNKRNESVISLSSQLGAMNESAAQMEVEITNLKASVQKLTTENCQLIQEDGQRKAEITDFKDNIQAFSEQNARLKSELQKTVAELSKAHEEVANLKTAVCDKDSKVKTAHSEKEILNLAIQGKDDTLKQQENLIQQLSSKIAEQEEQIKEKEGKVLELKDSVCILRGQVDSLTSESSILKNTLEKKEQSSLEYQSTSFAAFENLTSHLQAKEAECESLKEKISHLEEAISKLNNNLHVQMSEVAKLKMTLEEKEYIAQSKDASQLVSEMQKLEEQNKRLNEEIILSKEEHHKLHAALSNENTHLKEEFRKLFAEKEELEERHQLTLASQRELQVQMEQTSSSMNELMTSEKQNLQAEVSAKEEDIFQYKNTLNTHLPSPLAHQYSQLQEAMEEKSAVTAQLRTVSQTLRDTQNRCHWLESLGQAQGLLHTEVAPGAPPICLHFEVHTVGSSHRNINIIPVWLCLRLLEVELSLADERTRRETVEEALRLAEDRAKRLEPNAVEKCCISTSPFTRAPLIHQHKQCGMVACRRWLRGRSLYFSRLLTSRTRSRYFFLAYLLTIHVLVLMCLTGTL